MFFSNFIGAPSATIFKNDNNIIFDEKLIWAVDIDFYISWLSKHKTFGYCDIPLINVTTNDPDQVTFNCENNMCIEIKEYFYLNKKLDFSAADNARLFLFYLKLFKKYKIKGIADLRQCGQLGLAPKIARYVLAFIDLVY